MYNHLRPQPVEVGEWYQNYVDLVSAKDLRTALTDALLAFERLWPALQTLDTDFRYAPEKWTVAQVMRHMIDSEWVFAYRALRFARNDQTELPGYDHNGWAEQPVNETLPDLMAQFRSVRAATLDLFASFSEEAGLRGGTANQYYCSVRALGFIIAGHQLHHAEVLRERYLSAAV